MEELTVKTGSPAVTQRLGERLGALLEAGDIILLSGELGAGKTCLVQGIARGLGFSGPVTSKSFVIMGEYQGRLRLYHADLYRLESLEEVEDLGLIEYTRNGVLVVEWPERAWEVFPPERLLVQLEITSARSRRLDFKASGARYERLLEDLAKQKDTTRSPA